MRAIQPVLVASLVLLAAFPSSAGAPLPTELTLRGPTFVLVGENALFAGEHRVVLAHTPAPARTVQLYVDGAAAGRDTAWLGAYDVRHAFPARGTYALQAVAEEGQPAEARSLVLTVRAAVPPGAPEAVSAHALPGALRVEVAWSAPADDGGAPLTGYRVLRQTGDGAWVERATLAPTARSHVDAGLDATATYRYRVVSVNPVGVSPAAETPVLGTAPAAPTLTAAPQANATRVILRADATDADAQAIEIQKSLNGGATWSRLAVVEGASASLLDVVSFSQALPKYRALARSVVGASPPTPATILGDAPGVPGDVRVEVTSSVRLYWTPPTDGGVVQQYRVFDGETPVANLSTTRTSALLSITPGKDHAFRVQALSYAGEGLRSEPVALRLDSASAPRALSATVFEGYRNGHVNLSWEAPERDGNASILGYEVWRDPGPWGSAYRVATVGPDTFRFDLHNVTGDNRTYVYEVFARTAAGAGHKANVSVRLDLGWRMTFAVTAFRACETTNGATACTDVPANGTYTRTGTGEVTYAAVLGGMLTRKGEPQAGKGVFATAWGSEDEDGELAESLGGTTDATGVFSFTWSGSSITPTACTTRGVRSWASFDPAVAWLAASFQVCP